MPSFGPYGYALGNDSCSLTARILKIADSPGAIATGYVTAPSSYLDLGTNLYVRGGVSTTATDGSPSCLQSAYVSLSTRAPIYTGRIYPTNLTLTANFGSTTKTISTELVYRLPDLTDYYPGEAAVEQCTLVKFDAIPNTFTNANYLTEYSTMSDIQYQPILQPDPVFNTAPAEATGKQPRPGIQPAPTAARPGSPDITSLLPQITAILGEDDDPSDDQRGDDGNSNSGDAGYGGSGNAGQANVGSEDGAGSGSNSGSGENNNAGSQVGSGSGSGGGAADGGSSSSGDTGNSGSGNGQSIGDVVGGWIGAIIGSGGSNNAGANNGGAGSTNPGSGGGSNAGGSAGAVAIPNAGPGGVGSSGGSSSNGAAVAGSPGNGPVRGAAIGSGSSATSGGSQPNRVVTPITAPLTTQPAFLVNNQLVTAGGPSIMVDGKPLTLDASGTTATWGGSVIPVAQLAAAMGASASLSSTSLLVYKGQTLLPGGPSITVTSNGITQVLSMVAPTAPGATPRLVVLSQDGRDTNDVAKLIMLGLQVAGAVSPEESDSTTIDGDPLGAGWRVSAALESQRSKSQAAKLATTFLPTDGASATADAGQRSETGTGSGSSGPEGIASHEKAPLATGALFLLFVATLLLI
ncbi:Hypothetical protein D9617_5g070970 [Elsinoe fawcettii]|nr:Hypothetical protein D9617_5g070970 [Elsinoe fawcettii]